MNIAAVQVFAVCRLMAIPVSILAVLISLFLLAGFASERDTMPSRRSTRFVRVIAIASLYATAWSLCTGLIEICVIFLVENVFGEHIPYMRIMIPFLLLSIWILLFSVTAIAPEPYSRIQNISQASRVRRKDVIEYIAVFCALGLSLLVNWLAEITRWFFLTFPAAWGFFPFANSARQVLAMLLIQQSKWCAVVLFVFGSAVVLGTYLVGPSTFK